MASPLPLRLIFPPTECDQCTDHSLVGYGSSVEQKSWYAQNQSSNLTKSSAMIMYGSFLMKTTVTCTICDDSET